MPPKPLLTGMYCAAHADLSTSQFRDVNLSEALFENVDLKNCTFDDITLSGSTLRNVCLGNVTILDANLTGMTIDGIPVTDLLAAYRAQQGQ